MVKAVQTDGGEPGQVRVEQANSDHGCADQLSYDYGNSVQVVSEPATSTQADYDQASIEHAVSDHFEMVNPKLQADEGEGCPAAYNGYVMQDEGVHEKEGDAAVSTEDQSFAIQIELQTAILMSST
ncbi:hypothetical protein V6N13_045498 [Hibiscus sabdariffa]